MIKLKDIDMQQMQTYLNQSVPTARTYQSQIASSVLENGSTLVVLPTGMGKTLVALLVADAILQKGRVLFLAPTRPLATQHEKTCREWLNLKSEEIVLVSGLISANKRPQIYEKKPKVLISTPQTIANDLEKNNLKFDFSLAIFDEAHRAVGKYAYTKVANVAKEKNALILALTASPGGQKKKIEEILHALYIENVQIRTADDEDVKKYINPIEIEWVEVDLPQEILDMKKTLELMINQQSTTLKKMGYFAKFNNKKGLSELRAKILVSNSNLKYSALSYHATLFSLVHMLELLETQGIEALRRFIARIKQKNQSKAQIRILHDPRIEALEKKLETAQEHPKLAKLVQMIQNRPKNEKFIVFSQYRDQVQIIVSELEKFSIDAKAFMGKKDGITQKMQAKIIEEFRSDKFNVLVATSIGEEGLDIPSVDNVIFFEPVPSEIRTIQRRGRAGRAKLGRMFGLIARKTRDQAFFWSSKRKEEKMKKIVSAMSSKTTGIKQIEQSKIKQELYIKKDVKNADKNIETTELKKTDKKDEMKSIENGEKDLDRIKNNNTEIDEGKEIIKKEQKNSLPKTKYSKRTIKQTRILDF